MASAPEEFRRKSRKAVTLPSGLEVEIRKVWAWDFIDLGEIPLPSAGKNTEGSRPRSEDTRNYATRAIVRGALAPEFSADWTDRHNPDVVHVEDLSQQDMEALSSAILEWSGLTKEVAAEAEAFRDNGIGEAGGSSGPTLREAPDGDLKSDIG